MSLEPIIDVRNIGKKFFLSKQKKGLDLRDTMALCVRNPFFFFHKPTMETFWALQHITFSLFHGDTLGVIGPNGAGKSTLLKIICRVTPPTEGEIVLRGKVTSLLEIGTGFNLELTGKENVYLNGAIMGMKHREIQRKYESIIRFADIGKFIDIPVKYYSSGMSMRLAFSVASHLEPDILVIDEIMAVGDANFQKKSADKMREIQKKGKALICVSHNLKLIRELCKTSLVLIKGKIAYIGPTSQALKYYSTVQ